MSDKISLVVTSIASPNPVLRSLAAGCAERDFAFYVVGDVPSPTDFRLEGCDFYSLERQAGTGFRTAEILPKRHYARKNVGYLLAIRSGAEVIVETDDDNYPRAEFWEPRVRRRVVPHLCGAGWVNVYGYFSDLNIWPRGLPLETVQRVSPRFDSISAVEADCPIQQGLADENPDVDAIYRLLLPLPVNFRKNRTIALGPGSWSPFNSQNTSWWPDAYPLLYQPSYCSFRMTDIWRSFVAQRIAWENGWSILFHQASVYQERNDHSLMRDFQDEIPGYLNNARIAAALERLDLCAGTEHIGAALHQCYEALVRLALVDGKELTLVEAWLEDIAAVQQTSAAHA
jgi:hypothetical protein